MPASDPFPVLCLLQSHLEALAGRGQRRLWLSAEARQALREIVKMKPRPWTPEMMASAAAAAASSLPAGDEGAATTGNETHSGPSEAESPVLGELSAPADAGAVMGEAAAAASPDADRPELSVSTPAHAGADVEPPVQTAAVDSPAAGFSGNEREPEPAAPTALREESADDGWDEDRVTGESGEETWPSASVENTPPPPLTLAEKEARLAAVREQAEEGRAARALGTLRGKMVFATGRADAGIVLVGEAPGAEEERQGEPFVGPAGQLLNRILNAMGLQRGDVYISNICKFRPEMENQGSRNRQPSGLEMASCMDFVREEIRIIQPRVIVALGATAAAGLLGIKSGVMSARGRFYEFEGIPAMVTLHPSYLLHREKDGPETANAEKRKVWEDMLQVMERAGLPVSDKQRRFFLPR